jgi:phosphomethylpyrimidine synthase
MKITQEVREFARLNPTPLPRAGDGDSPAASGETAVESPLDPDAGMAEMSKRYREGGMELYIGADGREHD